MAAASPSSNERGSPSRGPQEGYEAIFSPPLERKYLCPICLAALREAVQTTCGHRFCRGCLSTLINASNGHVYLKCPVDNKWLCSDLEIFPDVAIRREVLSQYVRCDNHVQGCQWKGELRELQGHVSGCEFIRTPCTNECGEMVEPYQLEEHLLVCNKRLVVCQHCESDVVSSNMTKHLVLSCTKFPVKCTLCGKTGINREDIPKHVDSRIGDCPLAMVLCKYSEVGCTAQETRQNLPNHYRENCDNHLLLAVGRMNSEFNRFTRLGQYVFSTAMLQLMGASQRLQQKGNLYWRIDLSEVDDRFVSPAFFTGFPGYKVCVSLDLKGYTDSEGVLYTFINVELQPGDFDQSLTFPMSGLCCVTLFNHSEGSVSNNNYCKTFNFTDLLRCVEGDSSDSSVETSRQFLPRDDVFKCSRHSILYFEVSFTPYCAQA